MDDSNNPKPTRKKGRHLRVPVLPEEEVLIKQCAAETGMSVAAYLRTLALGSPVRSVVDSQQVETLIGISGELERLEKLLTLWLANDLRTAQIGENVIRSALNRITANQAEMTAAIRAVVRPRSEHP
jgi:hypothetical protein